MDPKDRKLARTVEAALKETQADKNPRTVYNPGGGDEPWYSITVDPADDADNDQFFCWIDPRDADGLVEDAEEYSDEKSFSDFAFEIVSDPSKYRRYPPAVDTMRVHLQKIGSMTSDKKAASARENGKKGGRPRKS